jgi:hypothetical protein
MLGLEKVHPLSWIAASAALLGGYASRSNYKLAARATSEEERYRHLEQAHEMGIYRNLGMAYIVYDGVKTYPRTMVGASVAVFGLAALVSWASLPPDERGFFPKLPPKKKKTPDVSAPKNVTGYYVPGLFPENWQAWDEQELSASQHAGWGR